jgi:uncharacterized membrane protein
MSQAEVLDARREAREDATVFIAVALALLVGLALMSLRGSWELLGIGGWVWLILCIPEVLLLVAFSMSSLNGEAHEVRRDVELLIALVVIGNMLNLALLLAALLTEKSQDLSGAQLLASGAVVWLTNVIVFGLCYWWFDAGGPVRRAMQGREHPDFQFPQDDNEKRAAPGWYPRLEDYVYVALTNGIAFSPTDAMPLTRGAKALMALDATVSVAAVLLVAARAVNVLGT